MKSITFKLIDSNGERHFYYPIHSKFNMHDVRHHQIFLIPSEKAKYMCGIENLKTINRKFQIQLPQDAYESARKNYPPIQTINHFSFEEEVSEFIKLHENQKGAGISLQPK